MVKYILTEKHGHRIAVICNEFGQETGIESAFIQDAAGGQSAVSQWVELANGCLCCSVKDDFVQALESLVDQKTKFDHVLVETTGAACHRCCWSADIGYGRLQQRTWAALKILNTCYPDRILVPDPRVM